MAFDRNPRKTVADSFIAGKTTEAVVRAIAELMYPAGLPPQTPDTLNAGSMLVALVERFDRKAEARALKGEDAA